MIYTNAHRAILNRHLTSLYPGIASLAVPDSSGSIRLTCRTLPAQCSLACDEEKVASMARAHYREHGLQMPVLIKTANIMSGKLCDEYIVNYIDYRCMRDMHDVARLIKERRLYVG